MSAPTPARRAAYEVLRRVFEHEAYADQAWRSAVARWQLEGRERALGQRLAYGAVQRRGTSDRIAGKLARRPASGIDAPLLAALRLGIFELLYDDGAAEHAAVDQAVELAKGEGAGRRSRGAGLVNAVLRRVASERESLLAGLGEQTAKAASAKHSIPRWIAELWWQERGAERARGLMSAANRPPQRLVRVNGIRADRRRLERELGEDGVELDAVESPLGDGAPLLEARAGPREPIERAIREGLLVPQSAGSAAAVALLAPAPGERVLDLCAAPGIKTTQLAEAVGSDGEVVAVERDRGRAAALRELCERMGASNVRVLVGDARRIELGSGYDRVLVDAPCSGLGTLASRPDLRWRRQPAEIEELSAQQAELLEAGAGTLAPGGSLLYSVCTISRREGPEPLERAVAGRDDLRVRELGGEHPELADEDPRFLQLLPDRDRTDGFFFAALERRR